MNTTTGKDYYAILGVARQATLSDIKRAYRKLAKQYHPDVNHHPDAAQKFRELTEAYDTLTDPDRRSRYDRLHATAGTRNTGSSNGNGNGSTGTGNGRHSPGSDSSRDRARTGPDGKDGQAASVILKILEDIWLEIRRRHPEIPAVVLIIASGTDGKNIRLGYHAPGRWNVAGIQRAEVMVSGEGLRRPAREVLGTLLHEAAHALADERGIQDTSRQGRYHNTRFAALAAEVGIDVAKDPKIGWSVTTVPDTTANAYAAQLTRLAEAMTIWRRIEAPAGGTQRRSTNLIPACCPCDRRIRVAASTLAAAPITCEACHGEFQPTA
jgi:curved DNA-binding protein CbpA